MTEQRMPLERLVAGWMADEASGAPQPVLEQILATTARTTPRPRVWALVAEPTLRGRATRAAVGLPNRGLVLATLVALLSAPHPEAHADRRRPGIPWRRGPRRRGAHWPYRQSGPRVAVPREWHRPRDPGRG